LTHYPLRLHKEIVGALRRAIECFLHPAPAVRRPEWRKARINP